MFAIDRVRVKTLWVPLLAFACTEPAPDTDVARNVLPDSTQALQLSDPRIAATRARLAELRTIEGVTMGGANRSTWVAWLDRATVEYIREQSDQGEFGAAVNEYWFADGQLIAYSMRATRAADPEQPAVHEQVTLAFSIAGDGSISEQAMTLNGRSVDVDETEIAGALARADFLVEQVRRTLPDSTRTGAPPATIA